MSEKAIKINCKAKVNGEDCYVTSLYANISINTFWPYVRLQTHPKKDAEQQAVKLSTADVAEEQGKIQKKIFQERTSSDCEINVSLDGDDSAGTFNFKGYLTGGAYEFSAGTVDKESQAVPEYALVSILNYSVYKQNVAWRQDLEPTFEDSFTDFIKQCGQKLMENWNENQESQSELEHEIANKQHELNQKAKQYWEQLLQDSDGEDKFGWEDAAEAMKDPAVGDDKLRQRVMYVLQNVNGPFETTIMQMAEEFQLTYVPQWDKIGYYLNNYNIMKNPEELSLDIVSMSCQGSNGMSLFPIKYVAVVPPQQSQYRQEGQPASYIVYPEEGLKEGGSMLRSSGPLWIDGSMATQEMDEEGEEPERRKKECDPDSVDEGPESAAEDEKTAGELVYDVCQKWAQAEYTYQALSGSNAKIVTTVNFKAELGKCYRVKSKKGGELFTGQLAIIEHSISTGDGRNPQAMTQLSFTNVCFPGFQLPGVDQ